jgi:hypothetical protein
MRTDGLPPGVTFDIAAGPERIQGELIALLPGDPWQGNPRRQAQARAAARPTLETDGELGRRIEAQDRRGA